MADATTIEGALIARLALGVDWRGVALGAASVPAIVGARVHPSGDPQQVARPKLTYQRVGSDRSAATGGMSNDGPTGLNVARLQFNCIADTLLAAKQLADAVRRSLNGLGPATLSGVAVGACRVADERETPAAIDPGQERAPQRITLDVRVAYGETA